MLTVLGYILGGIAAIFLMILFLSSGRMRRTPGGEAALPGVAQKVEELLREGGVAFSQVDPVWIYDYPKIKISFETEAETLLSVKLPVLQAAETLVAEQVRASEAFGANRETFDAKQALLLYCKETGRQTYGLQRQ